MLPEIKLILLLFPKVSNFINPQIDDPMGNTNPNRITSSPSWYMHSDMELSNFPLGGGGGGSSTTTTTTTTTTTLTAGTALPTTSSSSSLRAGSSSLSRQQQPLPPIELAQFKPVVNIHKRTNTTPVANLNQLINSASTDSFLNMIGNPSNGSGIVGSSIGVVSGDDHHHPHYHHHYHPNSKKHKSKAFDKSKVTIQDDDDDNDDVLLSDESVTNKSGVSSGGSKTTKKTTTAAAAMTPLAGGLGGSVSRSHSYNAVKTVSGDYQPSNKFDSAIDAIMSKVDSLKRANGKKIFIIFKPGSI